MRGKPTYDRFKRARISIPNDYNVSARRVAKDEAEALNILIDAYNEASEFITKSALAHLVLNVAIALDFELEAHRQREDRP